MRPSLKAAVLLLTLVCTGTGLGAQRAPAADTPDPSLGTWVLNLSRSQFPGPLPKLFIQRYERRSDGFEVSTRIEISDTGEPQFEQAVLKLDGKDYPWWDNANLADFLARSRRGPKTLSMRPVDPFTVDYTAKDAGKVIVTGQRTVARDGKTMTLTGKAATPDGQWATFTAVFDKQ